MTADKHETIGPWRCARVIDRGGNATVWEATGEGVDGPIALKVVNSRKAEGEPYRRFVREIEVLRSLGEQPGVLPLLDAYLPDHPSAGDRPWLAMPIAIPIRRALADQPLELVVQGMEVIANTLARLRHEHGIGHRDIKPGNLYKLGEEWLVGDFGLVALPDRGELTRQGKPLGPAHYTAYEMTLDPVGADPYPADVYAFGKTLWVLATQQSFPPEGHQPAATRRFSVADLRSHPHASVLDQLVDRATRLHANERPTIDEIARDLRAWRQLMSEPITFDVSEIGAQLRAKMERELAAEDLAEQRHELALAGVRRVQALVAPIDEGLRAVHPRAEINQIDDYTSKMLRTLQYGGAPQIVFHWARCSKIGSGEAYDRYSLRAGRGIELAIDGTLIFRAFVDVGREMLGGNDFSWESTARMAPVGSVEAEHMLEEGVAELAAEVREALAVFANNVGA